MNGSLSDGNENIVDIFVLSTRTPESPVQAGYLEQLGYRITFFPDSNQLFEALRAGKPNLLIGDSVTLHDDAYELCRLTKTDPDLWVIPVLIVTQASSLSDLLHVLDCNADNFISYPYDPAYLSSLIEGMLSTPVEPPAPEQIKTQFKIQHDNRLFVVTADRRRLLEFLLSSFEIAVNRSGDLVHMREETLQLTERLEKAEELCRDQSRSIGEMNTTIRENGQTISTLTEDKRSNEALIAETTAELQRLTARTESDQALLAQAEEHLARLTREAGENTRTYVEETGNLKEELAAVSADLAARKTELATVQKALAAETTRREEAERNLADTASRHESAEKSTRSLTLECEQMRVSLAAEKNRAHAAELEIQSLLQAKTESEQDLTRIITELKNTAKHQGSEINRQKEELDNGKNRIINLEIQLATIRTEKEQAETAAGTRAEEQARESADLREQLGIARSALADREREITGLETKLSEIEAAQDHAARKLQDLQEESVSLKETLATEREQHRAAEDRLDAQLRERNALLESLQKEHQSAQTDLDVHRSTLNRVRGDLESAVTTRSELETSLDAAMLKIRDLETELARTALAGEDARQQVLSLTGEMKRINAALDESRAQCAGSTDALTAERQEKEQIASASTGLEKELQEAASKIRMLESELRDTTTKAGESARQIQTLTEELDLAKAELESNRRARYGFEESLTGERLEKEQLSTDLRKLTGDRTALESALLEERQMRSAAESERERLAALLTATKSEVKDQETALSATIRELTGELSRSREQGNHLQVQVDTLVREKLLAEERAAALSAEIDQARTALADEWGSHMDAEERLVVAKNRKLPEESAAEKTRSRAVIVKNPDLPMAVGDSARALAEVAPAEVPAIIPENPAPAITHVDDLFEDDEIPAPETPRDVPTVSIVHEPASEDITGEEPLPEAEPSEDCGVPGADPLPPEPVSVYAEDDDEPGEEPGPVKGDAQGSSWGIAFNRAQWYDILKWAHHSGTLSSEQRMQIVRMGRLIQKGRKLTHKQEEQVREMISLVQAQGYRFA